MISPDVIPDNLLLNVVQSLLDKYPLSLEVARAKEISTDVAPVATSGDVAVTAVTLPLEAGIQLYFHYHR